MPNSSGRSSAFVNASRSQPTTVSKGSHRWFTLNDDDEPVEPLAATSRDSDQHARIDLDAQAKDAVEFTGHL